MVFVGSGRSATVWGFLSHSNSGHFAISRSSPASRPPVSVPASGSGRPTTDAGGACHARSGHSLAAQDIGRIVVPESVDHPTGGRDVAAADRLLPGAGGSPRMRGAADRSDRPVVRERRVRSCDQGVVVRRVAGCRRLSGAGLVGYAAVSSSAKSSACSMTRSTAAACLSGG